MDFDNTRQPSRRFWAGGMLGGGLWTVAAPAMAAEERPGDFFNVRLFGARGDGKTDDTRPSRRPSMPRRSRAARFSCLPPSTPARSCACGPRWL